MTAILRAKTVGQQDRKQCYRCEAWIALTRWDEHERLCLRRAQESDQRKKDAESRSRTDTLADNARRRGVGQG